MKGKLKKEIFSIISLENYILYPPLTGDSIFIFFSEFNPEINSLVGFYPDFNQFLREKYLAIEEKSFNEQIWNKSKSDLFTIAKQRGFKYALPDFFVVEIVEEIIEALDSEEMTFDEYVHLHFKKILNLVNQEFHEIHSNKFYEQL